MHYTLFSTWPFPPHWALLALMAVTLAAALFLSDRTVEGHLAHIFGKLGIRHRTEIAAVLGARQTQGIEAPNTGDSPVSAEPSAS